MFQALFKCGHKIGDFGVFGTCFRCRHDFLALGFGLYRLMNTLAIFILVLFGFELLTRVSMS